MISPSRQPSEHACIPTAHYERSDDENRCCANNQEASPLCACFRSKFRAAAIQRGQKFAGRLRSVFRVRRQHPFQKFDASGRDMQIFELLNGSSFVCFS